MASSAGKTSKFLFVDNDVLRISSTKAEEPRSRFAVNSHVQRWRAEQSKRNKDVIPRWEVQPSNPSRGVLSWRLKTPQGRRNLQSARYSGALLVHQIDPFASTGIQLDVESSGILHYFTSKWTPSACKCTEGSQTSLCTWPGIDGIPKSLGNKSSSMDETIRRCLFDKMHMYALLATSTGRMKYVSLDHLKRVDLPEFYMAKAIRMLRAYLEQCQTLDPQCILDLFFLCSFETYARNYEGAQLYLRVIRDVAGKFWGGIDTIEEHVRKLCWNADLRLAFILSTPPIFQLTWDPGPLLNGHPEFSWIFSESAARRGSTASVLDRLRTFSRPPLDAILEDLLECAEAMRALLAEKNDINRHQIMDRASALLYRLISLSATRNPSNAEEQREGCCLQALILWTWNILIGSVSSSARAANAQHLERMTPLHGARLKQAIYNTYSISNDCWSGHSDILFWILILGITVAGHEEDRDWFLQEIRRLAGTLGVWNVEQLSQILFDVLYTDEAVRADFTWLPAFLKPAGG